MLRRVFSGLAALPVLLSFGNAWAQAWEQINDEDGIVVWSREVPDTSFVEFRGRGVVEADIKQIIAVIRDNPRKPEWMKNCHSAAMVEQVAPTHEIIYNRTTSPAPFVSDRDVVLDGSVTFDRAGKQVKIDFVNATHKKVPEVDGVVRMPRLKGHWYLKELGPKKVEVEYQIQADPGGSLPAWLVNWVSKKLPLNTLQGLRKQVVKSGYEKYVAYLTESFDWEGFAGHVPPAKKEEAPAAPAVGAAVEATPASAPAPAAAQSPK